MEDHQRPLAAPLSRETATRSRSVTPQAQAAVGPDSYGDSNGADLGSTLAVYDELIPALLDDRGRLARACKQVVDQAPAMPGLAEEP